MKLSSVRPTLEIASVLRDPQSASSGPNPAYWVFSDISQSRWFNLTVIPPGSYGGEFPKTEGHYHHVADVETYHLISGQGLLLLQKPGPSPEIITEFLIVKVQPGEEVKITKEYGHAWINIGPDPLLSFDDWHSGHQESDYQPVLDLHGLAYYIINSQEEPQAIPNPAYQNPPSPVWLTAQEFRSRGYP